MTKDEFIIECEKLNGPLTEWELNSIMPCDCNSKSCNGWRVAIVPKQDSFALAGQPAMWAV